MYNDSTMAKQDDYQNPLYFYLFVGALFVGIIIIYILIQGMHKLRNLKEIKIQGQYGYKSFKVLSMETLVMLVIAGLIQMPLLTYLCNWINTAANSFNYAVIIDYNYLVYIMAFVVGAVMIMLIEGGLYALRVKKH